MKDVILTGVRSNDEPTLGNYLGAFVPMVRLQREKAGDYQLNMFVPDLHSFTTPVDHATLYDRTLKNLRYFVAAGLDVDNTDTHIYRQSYVAAHSELTWILDCFTYMGEMSRMTQFKEKSNDEANVSVGLFNYPVLMAADILLYNARYVPVGDDQKQHLEITRDIAMRMNNKFASALSDDGGELFTVPEDWKHQLEFASLDSGVRVRSLTNPEKKMSKSIDDPRGTILLSDTPADAAKKVMSATTDSVGEVHFDWENQPGITNLLQILALLTDRDQAHVNAEWEGKSSYGELKKAVADAVETFLTDFQARYHAVDETKLLAKLEASETTMRGVSEQTLLKVQQAVGLRPKV
jgi:tryptophanyl-tRNA synthetase